MNKIMQKVIERYGVRPDIRTFLKIQMSECQA